MTIPENKIYPRTEDKQTVYLKGVVTDPSISVGEYTMYNDFVNDPCDFQKNEAWDNHGDIVIGNDVWIGYEAVMMQGVTIGDGAIIGTRAVVTKDVPPYTIVGGVPAKPIRLRYPEETVADLLRLRWWDWPRERIAKNIQAIQAGMLTELA